MRYDERTGNTYLSPTDIHAKQAAEYKDEFAATQISAANARGKGFGIERFLASGTKGMTVKDFLALPEVEELWYAALIGAAEEAVPEKGGDGDG